MKQHTYIAIDLKSFYASVECRERGLDPLDTNLVVADESRTDKTMKRGCIVPSSSTSTLTETYAFLHCVSINPSSVHRKVKKKHEQVFMFLLTHGVSCGIIITRTAFRVSDHSIARTDFHVNGFRRKCVRVHKKF